MSKHYSTDEWFPDDQHGYSIGICRCDGGPYLGARKMGTPCRCERCGFITQDQFDFLRNAIAARALRELAGDLGETRIPVRDGGSSFIDLHARADEIEADR